MKSSEAVEVPSGSGFCRNLEKEEMPIMAVRTTKEGDAVRKMVAKLEELHFAYGGPDSSRLNHLVWILRDAQDSFLWELGDDVSDQVNDVIEAFDEEEKLRAKYKKAITPPDLTQ
jgi:hypothetical protein